MIVVLKVSVLYAHKMEFFNLVTFTRKNFWRPYRDPEEKLILAECKRICTIFVVVISFCAQGTCTGYMVTPIIGRLSDLSNEISLEKILIMFVFRFFFFSKHRKERIEQRIAVQLVGRFPRRIVALLRDPFHHTGYSFIIFLPNSLKIENIQEMCLIILCDNLFILSVCVILFCTII